ncbi:MAG: peptide chain release factor N(5)-glutamine methyltransferase [Gammaproteobacteria bacterium]
MTIVESAGTISIESALEEACRALASVSESPRLDAEILLSTALKKDRSHLRAWPEKTLTEVQQREFASLLQQRLQGVPVAYLTGQREFWSRPFEVGPSVLIPRPDTELLIELALALIPNDTPYRLVDLGTGSGIIAVTLALERPRAYIAAVDSSPDALATARRNAEKHGIATVRFVQSDWFSELPRETRFDMVIGNPPYIAPDDPHLRQGDLRFEPQNALVAQRNGLADVERIASDARNYLIDRGHLLLEHGYGQQHAVQKIFNDLGYDGVQTHRDLSGQPRATYGQWRR